METENTAVVKTTMENTENNQLVKEVNRDEISIFSSLELFDHWQRVAKMISSSNIVPINYQGNIANTMIAIELANRMQISPFMVMQNLDMIHGKPSWNSTFIISVINSCGRFEPLRFEFQGEKGTPDFGCYAVTKDKEGNILKSPKITWKMVKDEGWLDKKGSKWQTMPELMFQYRAASFFGRLYASDILKGMQSADEVIDVVSKPSELGQKEKQNQEETNRIKDFIAKAKSKKDLEALEGFVDGEELKAAFEAKEQELSKKKSA